MQRQEDPKCDIDKEQAWWPQQRIRCAFDIQSFRLSFVFDTKNYNRRKRQSKLNNSSI